MESVDVIDLIIQHTDLTMDDAKGGSSLRDLGVSSLGIIRVLVTLESTLDVELTAEELEMLMTTSLTEVQDVVDGVRVRAGQP